MALYPSRKTATRHDYRRYHDRAVYDRYHGHSHDTYLFPVLSKTGYVNRRYAYCEGRLLRGQASYRGPHVSFSLGF